MDYSDVSASPGVEYHYWISAVGTGGESGAVYCGATYRRANIGASPDMVEFDADGGYRNVTVWANAEWEVQSLPNWVTAAKRTVEHSDHSEVLLEIFVNGTAVERKGTIRLVAAKETAHPASCELYFSQKTGPGRLEMTVEETTAGGMLKVTVSRVGGSTGRVAVKLKTQDSATVSGINGVSGRDFQYLKEYLVWEDGDMSDKVVYIQTYATDATSATTLRLKLSAQTTGDYADCVTPTLADGGKVIATITPANKGTIAIVEPDPLEVIAGELLRVKVRRTGGSDGRVAVKLKTQDSATVDGINGVSGRDFQYVKEYLVWENGDVSDRIVEIPTYAAWWDGEPRTFRLKLSVQTAGDFAGCGTPELASGGKMIASIVPNDAAYPGAVVVKSVETDYSYSYEPPWWGYAGDTLRVTVSRVGGSFGRVVVKAKTQGYPGVSDLSAVLNEDLTYVKRYLDWGDGETEDRVVEIPTALVDGTDYPLTFRLKFTAQTTGDYEDCVEPELPEPKNVIELRRE